MSVEEILQEDDFTLEEGTEVTIKDIARICGVGVSTVSRAINNHPDINPVTKQAIMETIEKYGYIPNNSARNLKRTDAKCIAILVKGLNNPFFANMIRIIEEAVEKKHYSLVLRHVEFLEDEVEVALQLVKEKRLRGIVFLGGYFNHSEDRLSKINVPFVLATAGCVPENMNRMSYSSMSVDDEKEGYRMTQHLIAQGHKKIAILAAETEDASVGQLRLQGYKRALSESGIAIDNELICPMKKDIEYYTMENGYVVASELLDRRKDVTAIFAISDVLAVGACRAIKDKGLMIPKDIAVAGYDGIDMSQYYNPSISTVKQPVDDIAKDAIKLLFNIISGKQGHQHKVYDGELLIRESTDMVR